MSNPVIDEDGTKRWYLNGKLHREDSPACEWSDGTERWYLNGKLHRVDGPAVVSPYHKGWWLNGQRHRVDGPAVVSPYHKGWWLNDKLHRTDGPAIEMADGSKSWYLNGKQYIEEEFVMIQFMNGINIYV